MSQENLSQWRNQQVELVQQARGILDSLAADATEADTTKAETDHDGIMTQYDALALRISREAKQLELESRVREARADPRRPSAGDDESSPLSGDPESASQYRSAFVSYLRHGYGGMDTEQRQVLRTGFSDEGETRALSATAGASGGYLVPEGFMPMIVRSLKMWGPMLEDPGPCMMIVTSSGEQIPIPTLDDTAQSGARVAESAAVAAVADPTFGRKLLNAYKIGSGTIKIPTELFEDNFMAEAGLEDLIGSLLGERLSRAANTALTTGDGADDPEGVVVGSTKGIDAAVNTAISIDELKDLEHSVDPLYRMAPEKGYMLNDSSLKSFRKIKDSEGNYVWDDKDARMAAPSMLLGERYWINQAMDSIAATKKPVMYGCFKKYFVRQVGGVRLRRYDELYSENDQVGMRAWLRLDGVLTDASAVKHIATPA